MRTSCFIAGLCAALALAAPADAQDVALLGERYGTPLPQGYLRTMREDPGAFSFARGRTARLRSEARVRGAGDPAPARAVLPGPRLALGPREGPVAGTFRIPVVLGLFSDSPTTGPVAANLVQETYFSDSPGSITAYYQEASGGRATLLGDVRDWVRAGRTQADATGGESGLVSGTVGPFIADLLGLLPEIDWGVYDNDGPDGLPNSGDDDGFVDVLAVLHPTHGAECGGTQRGDRIWSHRWTLTDAAGSAYVTSSPAAAGGFIRIDDYIVQPVLSCAQTGLSEIGVFTHELGHAFGLPDLYDTVPDNGKHNGAGNWDLMATGPWGCDSRSPERPCHLGAWSKAVLGWVDVVTLAADTDHGSMTIAPVQEAGTVYRVEGEDGSGEYFLLENRQRVGFDLHLPREGLLVWHIDPETVAARWPVNTINGYDRMGVWLRQADGLGELETPGGGRGDAGDPYPFEDAERENREFHAGSRPSARSHAGVATGVTLSDIRRVADDVELSLSTRFTRITVRSTGDGGAGGLLSVDGVGLPDVTHVFLSAPFDAHDFEAAAGEPLGEGVRRPFVRWLDDASAPRVRTLTTPRSDLELTAEYGGRQVQLGIVTTGGINDVEPATFLTHPASEDLWFEEDLMVTVEAVAKVGFEFLRWTGDLEGRPNPATVQMDGPVRAGAEFELTYGLPAFVVRVTAAVEQSVTLAPENGNPPFTWRVVDGVLPEGISLDNGGTLRGAALETGSFPVMLEVWDAIGLTAQGLVTLEVDEPVFGVAELASPFLLTGGALDPVEQRFLDALGNRNGAYDLGDFRAWVLAHPGLPLSASFSAWIGVPRPAEVSRIPGSAGEGSR